MLVLCAWLAGCDKGRNAAGPPSDELGAQKAPPFVGAYYYPWYHAGRWSEQPATDTPRLGRYRSDDSKVAAQHIAWGKQADIDFFIVSWIAPDSLENRNLKRTLLPEMERAAFRFVLLYETPLALGLPAGSPIDLNRTLPNATKAGQALVEHFEHLAGQYFQHPSYLRCEGRPVVIVYVVRDMTNAAPYFRVLRERLGKRGVNPYLVADVVYWTAPEKLDWAFLQEHFQAVTGYNMYQSQRVGGTNYLGAVREQFYAVDRAARANGLRLIPGIMPGYDDTRLRGAGRPALSRAEGRFYRDSWGMAGEFVDARQPFLFLTSFNEWHEGTELEPSIEYGDSYLKLNHEYTAQLRKKLAEPKP